MVDCEPHAPVSAGANEEDDHTPPHQQALKEIQNLEKEDIDRITSSVVSVVQSLSSPYLNQAVASGSVTCVRCVQTLPTSFPLEAAPGTLPIIMDLRSTKTIPFIPLPQLDSLPITDQQKNEMAGAVESVAMGGINGAVWGSLAMGLMFLVGFNFMRSS